jgi:hypothetical protein
VLRCWLVCISECTVARNVRVSCTDRNGCLPSVRRHLSSHAMAGSAGVVIMVGACRYGNFVQMKHQVHSHIVDVPRLGYWAGRHRGIAS